MRFRRVGFSRYELVHVRVGADGLPLAWNPNVVDAFAASAPLYDAFVTVTVLPLVVSVPLHSCEIVCPLASVQLTVQPLIAVPPAVTVT